MQKQTSGFYVKFLPQTLNRVYGILFVSLFLMLTQVTCNKESKESERAALDQQKQLILAFAKAVKCGTNSECRFVPIGKKPCGGPSDYVVYSTSADTVQLLNMISDYTAREDAFNRRWRLVSDCSAPPPPDSVRCVDGVCVGYRNGIPVK